MNAPAWCPLHTSGCRAVAEWEAMDDGSGDAVVLCGAGHWFRVRVEMVVLVPE